MPLISELWSLESCEGLKLVYLKSVETFLQQYISVVLYYHLCRTGVSFLPFVLFQQVSAKDEFRKTWNPKFTLRRYFCHVGYSTLHVCMLLFGVQLTFHLSEG